MYNYALYGTNIALYFGLVNTIYEQTSKEMNIILHNPLRISVIF